MKEQAIDADQHRIPLSELAQRLNCSGEGLDSAEATRRLAEYGSNELRARKEAPELIKFLRQFSNFFALLLIAGAALAFLADYLRPGEGNAYIGFALLVVVLLNALFTYVQEHQSERILESFRNMLPQTISVLRDGQVSRIETRLLVPGDVILLEEGDRIPADGRLIEVNQLKVDHSSLTGESEPQLRKLTCTHDKLLESRNVVFSGTLVQSGNGRALVYATGMNTQIGRIVQLTKEAATVETPIRKELRHFIKIISAIAIVLGLVFFVLSVFLGSPFLGSLIFAIGIIVANVPEGLLPTVTLALTMASRRMARKNALIKNLEAVETLGSTTVICTDKTGTITQNQMRVSTLVFGEREWSAYQSGLAQADGFEQAWAAMALCNNARLAKHGFLGDPTEGALLEFAERHKPLADLQTRLPRIHESPFDSATRCMITTHSGERGQPKLAYMKGAPEVVFSNCRHLLRQGGPVAFDSAARQKALETYERLAARGERVLALAYKATEDAEADPGDFVFLGLVGMLDPPRPEIAEAIDKCRTAGIRVFMITGDYHVTAESIARQVGLFTGDGQIVLGERLQDMSEEDLSTLLDSRELVFARSTPMQKLRIVKALQKKGEVVTVTGDGVNDAPALKNADMGVAMGLSGTEVAKEAADMVLMDDNFATIVNAIEEGRTIFSNIKKFIAYILTSNIPEILPFIAFVVISAPLALTVVLILAIDLGTDLLPALGLGQEPPEHDVMKQPPRRRDERLLTWPLLGMSYGIFGMLQAAAGFFAFFVVLDRGGWTWGSPLPASGTLYKTAVTSFFAAVVICQVADVLICRTRRQSILSAGIFSNKLILAGIVVELGLLAAISHVPLVQPFFGTAPIGWFEVSLALPFAATIILGDEFRRWLIRRNNRFAQRWLSW
ncbi:MAG: cation-transporting P-type ATPase [Sterolibacteriaceae bacterium]|nr:cation-transporting P-type ATPase [Sterolibacteriaceae bacterium]MBK9084087.1 cation-transporting P-type ATPase [Sterolibacteriaceae bacterium]